MVGIGIVERMTPGTMCSDSNDASATVTPTSSHILAPLDFSEMGGVHAPAVWAVVVEEALGFVVAHVVDIADRFAAMREKECDTVSLMHLALVEKASVSHGVDVAEPRPTLGGAPHIDATPKSLRQGTNA
jgi:hypothetical protein